MSRVNEFIFILLMISMSEIDESPPDRHIPSYGFRTRRRSASMKIHRTTTPDVQSLLTFDFHDQNHHHEHPMILSNAEKLYQWKRTVEQQLNRIYFLKLKEINDLFEREHKPIDLQLGPIPSFEQLILVHLQQKNLTPVQLNQCYSYALSSNNILLACSNDQALIFDHLRSKLILYRPTDIVQSFSWNSIEAGEPIDLTYSFYLQRYFIITYRGLYLWSSDDQQHSPILPRYRLWTIASTENRSDVYLLYKLGSYIERWTSSHDKSSWQRIQRWSHHHLFERQDQRIRSIRMTSNLIAWTVETLSTNQWRVDLLDYQLQLIRRGISIDYLDRSSSCLISNYSNDQFFIIDSNRHRLFFLDSDGSIRYEENPLFNQRLRNAVWMNGVEFSYLVVRLQNSDQLCFFPLSTPPF